MLIIKALKVILALICSSYLRCQVIFYCSFKGNNLMVFGGLLKSHDTLLNVHNLFKYNVNSVKQALGYGERQKPGVQPSMGSQSARHNGVTEQQQ